MNREAIESLKNPEKILFKVTIAVKKFFSMQKCYRTRIAQNMNSFKKG